MERVLAIDFGTQRLGVAVTRGSLAEPLAIVKQGEQLWNRLLELVRVEQPALILIGLSENKMADLTRDFADQLQAQLELHQFQLPIELVDETLSSQVVHAKLAAAAAKRTKRQQPIDHYAAAEFLQEWLDTR